MLLTGDELSITSLVKGPDWPTRPRNAGIKAALGQFNGTDAAAVSLMTGLSAEELDDLGGLPT